MNKTILADRYEFLVYRLLRNRLEAGDIFVVIVSDFAVLRMT